MEQFWALFKQSVILQGAITLLCLGGTIFLVCAKQAVPDDLWKLNYIVVAFFFGSKSRPAGGS